jgi:hypothetical protein
MSAITTWEELDQKYRDLFSTGKRWLFRGQRITNWDLQPSLERALDRFKFLPPKPMKSYQDFFLRQFKRNFHRYSLYLPSDDNNAEWLALMQHHGAPTRLLDWTYSFHIALFFAIESANVGDRCAVWVVDNDFLRNHMLARLSDSERALYDENAKVPLILNKLLAVEEETIVGINPFKLNERLAIQQGVFLVSRCTTKSFMTTFKGLRRKRPDAFHKIEILCTKELLVDALRMLQSVNVWRVSLFPGLDGFCQSFENQLPLNNLQSYLK